MDFIVDKSLEECQKRLVGFDQEPSWIAMKGEMRCVVKMSYDAEEYSSFTLQRVPKNDRVKSPDLSNGRVTAIGQLERQFADTTYVKFQIQIDLSPFIKWNLLSSIFLIPICAFNL